MRGSWRVAQRKGLPVGGYVASQIHLAHAAPRTSRRRDRSVTAPQEHPRACGCCRGPHLEPCFLRHPACAAPFVRVMRIVGNCSPWFGSKSPRFSAASWRRLRRCYRFFRACCHCRGRAVVLVTAFLLALIG